MKKLLKLVFLFFSIIAIESCNFKNQKEITIMNFDGVNQEVNGDFYMSYVDSVGNVKHPQFKPNYKIQLDKREASELGNILKIMYPYREFVDSVACTPNYHDVILVNDIDAKKKWQLLICFECGQLDSYPKIKGLGNLAMPSRFDSLKSFFRKIDFKMGHKRDWEQYP
jgi:hypothetical protein